MGKRKNYKCRLIKWLELTTLDLYIVLWFSLMQRERLSFAKFQKKNCQEKYTSGKIFDFMLTYALISTQTMLVRSDIINKMNGFNENLRALEDYEFP